MESMNGGSLQSLLDAGHVFCEDDIAVVAYSVLRALELLHSKMITHSDIKVMFITLIITVEDLF